jgi:hypothetical protein
VFLLDNKAQLRASREDAGRFAFCPCDLISNAKNESALTVWVTQLKLPKAVEVDLMQL